MVVGCLCCHIHAAPVMGAAILKMNYMKSNKTLKKEKAEEMYNILNEFRRVYFVEGDLDKIAEVAHKALKIIREIDCSNVVTQNNII